MSSDPARVGALLEAVRTVSSAGDEASLLEELRATDRPCVVSFVNAHAINLACADETFLHDLTRSDVLLRDGVGAALAMRALGLEPGANENGTDLIPRLLDSLEERPVAIYGTRQPWVERAASALAERGLDVVGTADGYGEPEVYVDAARRQRPGVVVLAMGMPKQEHVAHHLRARLDEPVVIVNGGAIADFLAGRVPRAPRWVRALRLEWLFRLVLEPRRLWRRYVAGAPRLAANVTRIRLAGRAAR